MHCQTIRRVCVRVYVTIPKNVSSICARMNVICSLITSAFALFIFEGVQMSANVFGEKARQKKERINKHLMKSMNLLGFGAIFHCDFSNNAAFFDC